MERRPSRNTYSRRSSARNRKTGVDGSTRFSNQLSAAVILFVFILILAYTNSSATDRLREKTSAIIGRNVMDEFEDSGDLKDNVSELVRCMFSVPEDKSVEAEKTITNDIKNTADEPPAAEVPPEDTEPE